MPRIRSLNAIVYFEAVARHARLTTAAEELHVTPSAVSQRIRALEESLGTALFRRLKRRLILTEEGERFYGSVSEALGIVRRAEQRASKRSRRRVLTIRVALSFGTAWLTPRLPDFIRTHPWIDIHVDATSERTDFESENIDLEIRHGEETRKGLVAELIAEDTVLPLCNPAYPAFAFADKPHEALIRSRLIHSVKAMVTWDDWLARNGVFGVETSEGLRFDRSVSSIEMAAQGIGVALESTNLAYGELVTGRLVPMFPNLVCLKLRAYWLVCPSRHLNRRAVQDFRTWLFDETNRHRRKVQDLHARILGGAVYGDEVANAV